MRKKTISIFLILFIACSLAAPVNAHAGSSGDANLSSLIISNTVLSPAFSPTTYSGYTGSVARSTSSVTITPTVEDSNATYYITVKLASATQASGSAPVTFSVIGSNTYTITIVVTAQDGATNQTYTVSASKVSNEADAFLYYHSPSTVGLVISAGALTPAFDPGILNYSDSVLNGVSSVTVTPTADSNPVVETIKVNGMTVASGFASNPINLNVGDNAISILVTAQNGATQTYAITVTRAGATANLSALTISSGCTLSPAFDSNTTSYTASIPYGMGSLAVTPTADISSATITVNGTTVASGATSGPISVTTSGASVPITITVTNGDLNQTYTVDAIQDYNFNGYPLQAANSGTIQGQLFVDGGHGLDLTPYSQKFPVPAGTGVSWARLYVGVWGGKEVETGTLDITFNNTPLGTVGIGQSGPSGPAAWLLGSGNGVWWLAVDVTDKVTAGATNTVRLASSKISNSFDGRIYGAVLVAAVNQAGGPTVSYTVTEGHKKLNQANNVLSYTQSLNLPAGSSISGPADLTTVFLTGHPDTPNSLSINGHLLSTDAATGSGTDLSGDTWGGDPGGGWGGGTATSYFDLKHWDVTGLIAPENSVHYTLGSETYLAPVVTILSTQASQTSSDATLSNLTISSGSLSPAFAPGSLSYTASVDNSVSSLTVTPAASDSNASITVNGIAVASGAASQEIGLAVGANVISILVTAQNGTAQQTYTVTVNRAAPPAGAPVIAPSGGAYDAPQSITVSISAGLTVDQAVYYTTDGSAPTVAGSVYYTGPFSLYLNQGATTVQAAVYDSGSGLWGGVTTAAFTVNSVTLSSDATLSNLTISSGSLSPAFAPGSLSYTASVDNSVSSLTVTPAASDSNASITVNGIAVASGAASQEIGLAVGANVISILVTAQNGTAQQTYTVTVSRSSSSGGSVPGSDAPAVTGISPTSGPYSGGTTVTITGTGFTGATAVNFGTKAVTSTSSLDSAYFTINSATSITVVSPGVDAGGVTVDVTVTGPKGISTTNGNDKFTYLVPEGYKGMNKGASPLETALHDKDDTGGGLLFTRGDSQYCSKLPVGGTYTVHLPVAGIPAEGSVKVARLYTYYCWSVNGQPANVNMTLNGRTANLLNNYSDVKGMDPWNYPFGTVSFDATGIVSGNGSYTAVLKNTGSGTICPFGIGLVVVYHDPQGQPFEYWLNEGADIIWPGDGVTVAEATTYSRFPGTIDTSKVSGAELITVVTSGNKGLNTLTFNGRAWQGVYRDATQLAVGDTDVTASLRGSDNTLSIDSEGSGVMGPNGEFSQADTMCPSNAFLAVTYKTADSEVGGTVTPSAGGTVSLGSDITVTIPAGALNGTKDVNVKIQKISSHPPAPAGFKLLGTAFEITAGDSAGYKFAKPVTLTLAIDPAALAAGEVPSIYYYDETSSQWVSLGGTVSGNTITVDVDHFTKFAVLAKEAEFPPVPMPTDAAAVQQAPFSDVPADFWASSVIAEVYGLGYIGGYTDGTFRPNNSITRAEFVTILVKAFKVPAVAGIFFDDTMSHWARNYIATAYHAGIAGGYSANSFGPDDPVTREQMAVMIAKAAKIKAATAEIAFQDRDQISAWAGDALAAVAQNGIMKGYPDGAFNPQQSATRAEAVMAIANALKSSQ